MSIEDPFIVEGLTLKPGGTLDNVRWIYDVAKEEGSYVAFDVTDRGCEFLMDNVTLQDGVRLLDIFKLLQKNKIIQTVFKRDWAADYVEEAIKHAVKPYNGNYADDGIEFLELYSIWERNSATGELSGLNRLNLHGIGFTLINDIHQYGTLMHAKQSRIPWSVSFCPIADILDIPIKFNPNVMVCEGDTNSATYGTVLEKLITSLPTLGQVIHAIFWELSFHGGPKETSEYASRLKAEMEEWNNREIDETITKESS
jgi:hypothetical protein